ncbi:hypothetical protein AN958_07485 [Leucoagaricus sp. SymC.cos]|nr:hypothetical protein AN958_07485 [Leucoagaricus sp. SymC.cos]
MPPAKAAVPAARKRTRKRKRRAVSSSSSSSSSDSSSSEDEAPTTFVRTVPKVTKSIEESSEPDSDSDSADSSSSASETSPPKPIAASSLPAASQKPAKTHRSPSPSPPPVEISSFLPPPGDPSAEEKEKELKEKFRKFWMSSVADGFRDDLEELRKEPNLGTGRLALLIDSLASGAEVFSSKADGDVSEMDVIMG